ncbi:hypothetical protein Rhal01_00183 [Rubritalea halochordaticola]|uniref:beta-N-acetylhexosaminidase n=1 Tax=Rubritalea halochordaticola TaxID=714537 RepID=A0ABP9UU74_9BACT
MLKHLILSLSLFLSPFLTAQESLIPKPVSYQAAEGSFTLTKNTALKVEAKEAKSAANYLSERLKTVAGIDLENADNAPNSITFKAAQLNGKAVSGTYKLSVADQSVTIEAADQSGFFYGAITLLQLMPAEVWSRETLKKEELTTFPVPCCSIMDYPRFAWRGMMLDCSRQFFPKEYVKLFIDRMAQYKLNVFHWHLTDDEGWRVEIKKYPLLTEIGSKRGPGTKLPYNILPAISVPDKSKPQEGFYTQEEIKEVVAYAAERSITVIPEIDVPGHAKAAIVAYPELLQHPEDKSQYRSVQGTPNNTIDAGLESSYEFLDNVFAEIAELFPATYIHVGGDERPHGAWEKSPSVKELMKKENLKNTDEVQGYFFQRLEKILAKYDRKLLGWEEILHGDKLKRDDSAIISWRSQKAGIEAAKAGRDAIMAPAQYIYYDLKHVRHPQETGLVWAGVTDTKDSYSYNPLSGIPESAHKHILGVNGCLWGETLISQEVADYMSWPRMFALSEIAWTPQDQRQWEDFSKRAFVFNLPKLDAQNVHYRIPLPSASLSSEGLLTITTPYEGAQVRYTTDGSKPTTESPLYEQPFTLEQGTPLKMVTFTETGRLSRIIEGYSVPPVAKWSPKQTPRNFTTVDFDVSKVVNKVGTYTFSFIYQKGKNALDIKSVSLLVNGKTIATDTHKGFAGTKLTNHSYTLTAKNITEFKKSVLRVECQGSGGTDSHGEVIMSFEPIRPERTVSTNMSAYKDHKPALAADYKDSTWFWLDREPKAGDQITVTYTDPQTGTVSVETGKTDGHDQLVAGELQISEDGKNFTKAAEIVFGKAEYKLPEGKSVKAIRLLVTETQKNTWLIVRELHVR